MKSNQEIQEVKSEIADIIDDLFVDLFDDGFDVKYHSGYRSVEIKIKNKRSFKVSTIQSKTMMLVDYLKTQYSHISYESKLTSKQTIYFPHFPLFFYKEINQFNIIITI